MVRKTFDTGLSKLTNLLALVKPSSCKDRLFDFPCSVIKV